jgi:hypothetical protein
VDASGKPTAKANPAQAHRSYADKSRNGVRVEKERGERTRERLMNWFLKRVFLVWLFLTVITIAVVLQSIHQSGGFT